MISRKIIIFKKNPFVFQAVAKMVQECYTYVDKLTDLTVKLRLIDTLRTVTAGKVWFAQIFCMCEIDVLQVCLLYMIAMCAGSGLSFRSMWRSSVPG